MKTYLRVKILSLAAEARIIHRLEQRRLRYLRAIKWGGAYDAEFWGLRNHRKHDVRGECRSANLAYGFLRGRPYKSMEAKCYTPPDWKRVQALISKYGDAIHFEQRFSEWKSA